jgi:hypothetical protein
MFYLEFLLYTIIIISFVGHFVMRDVYSFYLYNTTTVIIALLSLNKVNAIVHNRDLYDIYLYIIYYGFDALNVVCFLMLYFFCV